MKSVLISIQPKWCELIVSGKKAVEVRKTKPKLETPFKCYIYCTKGNLALLRDDTDTEKYKYDVWESADFHQSCGKTILGGKVIGEFVCNRIDEYRYGVYEGEFCYHIPTEEGEKTCLEYTEAEEYGNGKPLYFWHISDLVIYDKPRELSEFRSYDCRVYIDENGYPIPTHEITRPPQSWCYVEGERKVGAE